MWTAKGWWAMTGSNRRQEEVWLKRSAPARIAIRLSPTAMPNRGESSVALVVTASGLKSKQPRGSLSAKERRLERCGRIFSGRFPPNASNAALVPNGTGGRYHFRWTILTAIPTITMQAICGCSAPTVTPRRRRGGGETRSLMPAINTSRSTERKWWAMQGSNLRHRLCKSRALPAELIALLFSYQFRTILNEISEASNG